MLAKLRHKTPIFRTEEEDDDLFDLFGLIVKYSIQSICSRMLIFNYLHTNIAWLGVQNAAVACIVYYVVRRIGRFTNLS